MATTTYYMSGISLVLQYLSAIGVLQAAAGGQLTTNVGGSVGTLVTTYASSTGLVANPNPMTLSSTGTPVSASGAPVAFWVPGGTVVQLIVTDALGNQLFFLDNVPALNDLTNATNALQTLLANPASSNVAGFGPVAGVDLVANAVKSYDVFADVRAANIPVLAVGQTLNIEVQGGLAVNDGLGGFFYWSATATGGDDGKLILKPALLAPASPGRWVRYWPLGLGNTAVLTADQSVTSSTVLIATPASLTLVPGVYLLRVRLLFLGTGGTGQGYQWQLTLGGGGSLQGPNVGQGISSSNGTATVVSPAPLVGSASTSAAVSSTTGDMVEADFVLTVTSTSTLTVQIAQEASSANSTVLKAGSLLSAQRVAEMLQYFDTLTDDSGNALLGATVKVTNYPSGTLASIFNTNGTVSPVANSTVIADITGQVSFYAPDGAYTLIYSYKGTPYKTRSPVQMIDPISFTLIADTGAANAYVIADQRLPAQLYVGLKVEMLAANSCTGPSTFNLNSTGAVNIVQSGGSAIVAGNIIGTGIYRLEYDGTNWQLVSLQPVTAAVIGGLLYPKSAAETAAGVTPTTFTYPYGDVRRYGTVTGSGGADTAILQAAINQSMQTGGSPWLVPAGVTLSVQTAGSTTTPVGDACTITATCIGVIDGAILGNNNCNIINCSGNNVTVTGRGLIKGYGTYFATGAFNGACFKNSGSYCVFSVNVVSPPQYGVYWESATAQGGVIGPLSCTGGIGSYVNNQNYGVETEGPWQGLVITGIKIFPDGGGGVVVQGVAGGFDGGVPTNATLSNLNINGCWDHSLYFFCVGSSISNITANDCGAGIRIVGTNNACSNFLCSNSIGGIDFEDANGSSLTGFTLNDIHGIALSVELLDTVTDGSMSNLAISNGTITFQSGDTAARCGVRVLCDFGGVNTNQWNIDLTNVVIVNATQSATSEGAIRLEVPTGKTLSRVRVQNCIIDTPGYIGIELAGGGTLLDSHIDNNTVRDPGANAAASGSATSAISIGAGTTMQYGSVNFNDAIDDRGGSAKMVTAYTVAGTQTFVAFNGNSARGYTTSFGSFLQAGDYVAGTTTPSVQNRNGLDIANSGATTITNFLNAQEGQVIFLTFEDANTTITRANAVLAGGVNFTSAANHTLTLLRRGSVWWEICRSSNS